MTTSSIGSSERASRLMAVSTPLAPPPITATRWAVRTGMASVTAVTVLDRSSLATYRRSLGLAVDEVAPRVVDQPERHVVGRRPAVRAVVGHVVADRHRVGVGADLAEG